MWPDWDPTSPHPRRPGHPPPTFHLPRPLTQPLTSLLAFSHYFSLSLIPISPLPPPSQPPAPRALSLLRPTSPQPQFHRPSSSSLWWPYTLFIFPILSPHPLSTGLWPLLLPFSLLATGPLKSPQPVPISHAFITPSIVLPLHPHISPHLLVLVFPIHPTHPKPSVKTGDHY